MKKIIALFSLFSLFLWLPALAAVSPVSPSLAVLGEIIPAQGFMAKKPFVYEVRQQVAPAVLSPSHLNNTLQISIAQTKGLIGYCAIQAEGFRSPGIILKKPNLVAMEENKTNTTLYPVVARSLA